MDLSIYSAPKHLQRLKDFDLRKTSYGEIYKHIEDNLIVPVTTIVLTKDGHSIYRARINEGGDFTTQKELSYNLEKNITSFGRANIPAQSIFYGSNSEDAAIVEVTKLTGPVSQKLKTETISIGRWRVKENLTLVTLLLNESALQKNTVIKELATQLRNQDDWTEFYRDDVKLVLDYFCNEFAKPASEELHYKITAAFANIIRNRTEGQIDGILFPSVKFEYEHNNFAIFPKAVDQKMELEMVIVRAQECIGCEINSTPVRFADNIRQEQGILYMDINPKDLISPFA